MRLRKANKVLIAGPGGIKPVPNIRKGMATSILESCLPGSIVITVSGDWLGNSVRTRCKHLGIPTFNRSPIGSKELLIGKLAWEVSTVLAVYSGETNSYAFVASEIASRMSLLISLYVFDYTLLTQELEKNRA